MINHTFLPEVDESWKCLDRIPLCQLWILNLYHMNAKDVALVVDQFKTLQDLIANVAIYFVCNLYKN